MNLGQEESPVEKSDFLSNLGLYLPKRTQIAAWYNLQDHLDVNYIEGVDCVDQVSTVRVKMDSEDAGIGLVTHCHLTSICHSTLYTESR